MKTINGEEITDNAAIELIDDSLLNGQRRQMVEYIDEYGVGGFWADYKAWLCRTVSTKADQLYYFTDATISYFRIKGE